MLLTLTIRSISMLFGVKTLLQRLLDSNSHGNGHADHGVVACAQEAHHFHVIPGYFMVFAENIRLAPGCVTARTVPARDGGPAAAPKPHTANILCPVGTAWPSFQLSAYFSRQCCMY